MTLTSINADPQLPPERTEFEAHLEHDVDRTGVLIWAGEHKPQGVGEGFEVRAIPKQQFFANQTQVEGDAQGTEVFALRCHPVIQLR